MNFSSGGTGWARYNICRSDKEEGKMAGKVPHCDECGKPLKAYACSECNGSGVRRLLWLFELSCDVCDGRGVMIRCPDACAHATARIQALLSKPPTFPATRIRKLGTPPSLGAESKSKRCPRCNGTGKIVTRQLNPDLGKRFFLGPRYVTNWVPCTTCWGRGWLPLKRGGL